jgi:hypothetical protein
VVFDRQLAPGDRLDGADDEAEPAGDEYTQQLLPGARPRALEELADAAATPMRSEDAA